MEKSTNTENPILLFSSFCSDNQRDLGSKRTVILEIGEYKSIILHIENITSLPKSTSIAVSNGSDGTVIKRRVTGILLDRLLSVYGKNKLKEFDGLIVTANDGYSVEIPKRILLNRKVILVYYIDPVPISIEQGKKDERGLYCVKNVNKLRLVIHTTVTKCDTLFFLEGLSRKCNTVPYKYHGHDDRALSVSDVLSTYIRNKTEFVTLAALDGLLKNERYQIFSHNLIKITGEDAPLWGFGGISSGMQVKKLLYAKIGSKAIVSGAGLSYYSCIGKALSSIKLKRGSRVSIVTLEGAAKYISFDDFINSKALVQNGFLCIDINGDRISNIFSCEVL